MPSSRDGGPEHRADLLAQSENDPAALATVIRTMRAADIAAALRDLEPARSARVLAALPFELAAQVFDQAELDGRRAAIVRGIEHSRLRSLIEAMSPDQQADLFRELPSEDRDRLMTELDPDTRDVLRLLLRYPADTAGGIMTTSFVAVPDGWTVGDALDHIRRVGRGKETVYAIYIVDADERLVHVASLRDLIFATPDQRVRAVGDRRQPISVLPLTDREEVARVISRYNLLTIPVVDETRRMLGIVTVDDVIDAIVREQTEDVQKFGGVQTFAEPYMSLAYGTLVKKRAGWLIALFFGEMLTATALGHYEHQIASAVVLALFIPLIISAGGNSGGQSTSLILTAMALRQVGPGDWRRVATRDLSVGLTLGLILGTIAFVRIVLFQAIGVSDYGPHAYLLATAIGLAVLAVVSFGSFVGSMLPFLIRGAGLDPATASAPFVATLVDVTGIIIYFTLATLILRGTVL